MSPPAVILLADDDLFEAGYLTATLQSRGCEVRGPCSGVDHALQLAEREPTIIAAVIGKRGGEESNDALLTELQGRGIPCLLLMPGPVPDKQVDVTTPILVKPFASYQVADWVSAIALPPGDAAASPTHAGSDNADREASAPASADQA